MFLLQPARIPPSLRPALSSRELSAGEHLYYRGDKSIAVFAVESGRLQLFSTTSEGKTVPLYAIREGECVSEPALYADVYCGDVVAEIPSRVLVCPKEPLLQALRESPLLADEFMTLLTRRFNLLRVRLELRNVQSARERILQYLTLLTPPGQAWVLIDRPLKTIAEELGLTHESFYRSLTELVREGKITRTKGHLSLEQPAKQDRGHAVSGVLREKAGDNRRLRVP